MPSTSYFDLPYLSSHTLADFAHKGPRYVKAREQGIISFNLGRKGVLGTAVHHGVEHRDVAAIEARYELIPAEFVTASGGLSTKKAAKEWAASVDLESFLTFEEMQTAERCARSILSHAKASALLAESKPEVVGVDESLGIKGCCDEVGPAHLADIKTTALTVREFQAEIARARKWLDTRDGYPDYFVSYLLQVGQYCMLWPERVWHWIVVEKKTELSECMVLTAHEDTRAACIHYWRECYQAWKTCQESDGWEQDYVAIV